MTEVDRKPVGDGSGKRKRRPRGRPKGHRITVLQTERITAICTRFHLTGPILTIRDVADALSKRAGRRIGLGTVHRLVKGIEPERAAVRQALGLPPRQWVTACQCGEVHVSNRCPNKPATPRKPRTDWKARALIAEAEVEALRELLADERGELVP